MEDLEDIKKRYQTLKTFSKGTPTQEFFAVSHLTAKRFSSNKTQNELGNVFKLYSVLKKKVS